MPERRRGGGCPPKTCSEECRKRRASELEKQRYYRVKHTDSWKRTRAIYVDKLNRKIAKDPEFAAMHRAYAASRERKWITKLKHEDPSRYEQIKARKRAERVRWREQLLSDPEAFEGYKAECRSWYHGLSEHDRKRIYGKTSGRV